MKCSLASWGRLSWQHLAECLGDQPGAWQCVALGWQLAVREMPTACLGQIGVK